MIDRSDAVRVRDLLCRRRAIRDGRPQAVKIGAGDVPQRPGDQASTGVAAREVQPHVPELADSIIELEARRGPDPGVVSDRQLVDRRQLDNDLRYLRGHHVGAGQRPDLGIHAGVAKVVDDRLPDAVERPGLLCLR